MNCDFLDWVYGQIERNADQPFVMGNEKLADETFEFIHKEFPNAKMVKCNDTQWITATKNAEKILCGKLICSKAEHERKIDEIDAALEVLS